MTSPDPGERRRAFVLMVLAPLMWSTSGIIVRNTSLTNSWEVVFWRSLFCGLALAAWLLVHNGRDALRPMVDAGRAGMVSGLLWASMFTCFLLAITRTSVANTQVLISVAPLFAAIAGRVAFSERVPARTWIAITVSLAGIAVMFADALQGGGLAGNLIALLVPLAFALNVVMLKRMGRVDMLPAVLWGAIFSAVGVLPLAMPLTASRRDLLLMAVMGVAQLAIPCVLMTRAAVALSAAEVGLLQLLETLCAPLWVWLALGEAPGRLALVGGTIVLVALVVNELSGLLHRRRLVRRVRA